MIRSILTEDGIQLQVLVYGSNMIQFLTDGFQSQLLRLFFILVLTIIRISLNLS